ncbi:MAG: tetratricopeptide repeat protein [Candidatus Omnitrophica bacterium]|nr:tetratricopeptide repeat protein [Candidatus Omnitrophota bacterium]
MVKRSKVWFLLIFYFCLVANVWAVSLEEAQQDYLLGNYEEAIVKARRLHENDETLYFLGLAYTKTADYERARAYLDKLIDRFPGSDFRNLAMMKLADTYFLQKDYDKAKELYQIIESKCLKLENPSLLFLRLAQIASRRGEWEDKGKYLELIKKKYPNSPEMYFVKTLEEYGDFFTIQVGAFSQKKNAVLLKDEVTCESKAYIVEGKSGAYPIYKVRVGKFKKRYDADKVAQDLRSQGYPASIYP